MITRFIDYFDCIYLLELKLTDTTNTARSTSYLERYFLIIEMISILTLWIVHLYVATFQQHLQMENTSLFWNDFRLHEDFLHAFGYALSRPCHELTLTCLVCTYCRSYLCPRSWLVTMCDIWQAVGVGSIMNATCGTIFILFLIARTT